MLTLQYSCSNITLMATLTLLGLRVSYPRLPTSCTQSIKQRLQALPITQQQLCTILRWRYRHTHAGCKQRHAACLAAYRENPQNVDNPRRLPSPELSAQQAVEVQLAALQANDEPWQNHGIQTAYAFALDVGGLDPSMYFGFPKDLYHQDHFQGMFANRLPELVNNQGFIISNIRDVSPTAEYPATTIVTAVVQPAGAAARVVADFHLRCKTVGARKGCLMTHMVLLRRDGQE